MQNRDAITLKHLRCFIEVYHRRSVANAAEVLGITQPAASRRLSDFEALLDQALFHREGRRMVPTAAADAFIRTAEATVVRLQTGLAALQGEASRAVLPVGVLPTVAGTLLPTAILALRTSAPGLTLSVESGAGHLLLPRLRAGHLDAVVGRMAVVEALEGLAFETLFQDRLAFVARPDHPLAGQAVTASDLADWPLILPPRSAVIRATVDTFLAARGQGMIPISLETTSATLAVPVLQQTDAIWAISRLVAEPDIAQGQLIALGVDTGDTIGSIGVTWRADEGRNTALDQFRAALRAARNA